MADAANRIDRELAIDPEGVGSQVSQRFLELTIPPLQVLYGASHEDRIVQVFSDSRI